MKKPNLPYSTLQDIGAELKLQHFPNLHSLPYNRFNLNQSEHWWLSPTRDKAAFPFGKIILTTDDSWVPPGQTFCGFNVEKGINSKLAQHESQRMTKKWFWHIFTRHASKPLMIRIQSAAEATEHPIQIIVTAGELVPNAHWGLVKFDTNDETLTLVDYFEGNSTLSKLANVTSYGEFGNQLRAIIKNQETSFQWFDVLIGTYFTHDTNGPDNLDVVQALIEPFASWIRS